MKFPIVNISIETWNPKIDYLTYNLQDEYIYTDSEDTYTTYFQNMKYVDSEGKIYKLVNKKSPNSRWRHFFKIIPNVFKVELIFIKTEETMGIESVREFIIRQLSLLGNEDYINEWKEDISEAKSIEEILGGI